MPKSILAWRDVAEQAAYHRLSDMLHRIQKIELADTREALAALLRRRKSEGEWNWGIFEDFVNDFRLEFAALDETYEDGIQVLDGILTRVFEIKRHKGKKIDLRETFWNPEELALVEAKLATVTRCANLASDRETKMLLVGLAHVIRYETKGEFARAWIDRWAQIPRETRSPERRRELAERFLRVRNESSGKADSTHIRNAFAHAHFDMEKGYRILLWDEQDGEETYSTYLTLPELMNFSNTFEKKLAIVELYPTLLLAINDLHSVYQREWKAFRRQSPDAALHRRGTDEVSESSHESRGRRP
jgi:hypothetical protein